MLLFSEGNNATVNGHPAWATEYDLATNTFRTMDVYSNSFCAGGIALGNGTWLNVGGNQAIGYGGNAVTAGTTPYDDYDGGMAIRLLDTCDDQSCNWIDDPALYMTSRRWYPTLETLEDGSAMILGGCQYGGYVNSGNTQNNPTVEVSRGVLLIPTLNTLLTEIRFSISPQKGSPSHSNSSSTRCPSTCSPSRGSFPLATSSSRPNSRRRYSTTRT